jgi:hypothetical protein
VVSEPCFAPPSRPGFVPAIHVFLAYVDSKDVDARHKAGHDENPILARRHSGARAERANPEIQWFLHEIPGSR